MSLPSNPLAKFGSYEVKHTLIAFENAEAAYKFKASEFELGKPGTYLPKRSLACGRACVVVNENESANLVINRLRWSFDFYSPLNPTTTACVGEISISGDQQLVVPNFMRKITQEMDISLYHITFALFTFFKGRLGMGGEQVIACKPLFFNIIDSHTAVDETIPFCQNYNFVAQYNTLAQLPQFASMTQTTITHQDGSLGQSMPFLGGATSGIMSRKEENAIKNWTRKARMNRSKPMQTLKELTDGLQQELNDQIKPNRRQLQEFMALVRDDFVKKIKDPKQKKDEKGGISVEYKVVLDDHYANMPVNNRNLPFEQPDQGQNVKGLTSLTIPGESDITDAINEILRTSTLVAKDIAEGYSYKTVAVASTDCSGKYHVTVKVKRFVTPVNEVDGNNTSPGAAVKTPLQFFFGEGNEKDFDIVSLALAVGPPSHLSVTEDDHVDGEGQVVYGDREQISLERSASERFNKSFFSGNRGLSNAHNYGLESGSAGSLIDINNSRFIAAQTSLTVIGIAGNPDLYSDLCRNPEKVVDGDDDHAILYKFPEYEPMYVDLSIRLVKEGNANLSSDQTYYYYKGSYHVAGVTNTIQGSTFVQTLKLLRTDDS